MFHSVYVWLYERKDRSRSFVLPPHLDEMNQSALHLGNFLARTGLQSKRTFSPYDHLRRRKRMAQVIATVVLIGLLLWISYESITALAILN